MQYLERFTKRERVIGLTTLIIAVCIASYVLAIEPLALKWFALRAQAIKAESDLARLESLVEYKDTIERESKRLKGAVAKGQTEQDLRVALLQEVDAVARVCGLELSSVKPTTARKEGAFLRYGIELQVHCAGHQFAKLLQAFQEPEHLLRTDKMTVSVGPSDPPMTATLTLSKLVRLEK